MLEIATESGYLVRRLRYWLQSPIIIDMKQALYRPQTKFKHKIPYVEHLALLRYTHIQCLDVLVGNRLEIEFFVVSIENHYLPYCRSSPILFETTS